MKTDIVPATIELLEKFYGCVPPRTARACVALRDERVIGVAGVYMLDGKLVVFADLTQEIRSDRRAMIRGIREVLRMAAAQRLPVYAMADQAIDGADILLKHMGFVAASREVYVWPR